MVSNKITLNYLFYVFKKTLMIYIFLFLKNRIDRGRGANIRSLIFLRPENSGPEDWRDVKYMIFDSPPSLSSQECNNLLFEERMEKIKQVYENKEYILVCCNF